MKNSINIEKLLKEAKIIYWKENDVTLYQKNTIGILDNTKNTENKDRPLLIQYSRGD